MAEKSKEKKRSGNVTLIATALALIVGGTALWSINRSISTPDTAGTGIFPAKTPVVAASSVASAPRVQANVAVTPPPDQDIAPEVYRVPPLHQSPATPFSLSAMPIDRPMTDTAAVDVDPDAAMQEDPAEATEPLTSIATASGTANATAEDVQDEAASADPDIAATKELLVPDDPELDAGSSYYIAIGSYIRRGNALRVKQQRQAWKPQIREAMVDGRHFYRLVVGPFSFKDLATARARMRKAGVVGEWPVRADSDTQRADLALLD